MQQPIKVVIVDDHMGVRKGIQKLMEKEGDFRVIGQAADGQEAIQLVNYQTPDLVILDVQLPRMRGDEVANKLLNSAPQVKILALSSFDNPDYIREMLENGAHGYLTKDEAPALLTTAAKDIVAGKTQPWLSKNLQKSIRI